MSTLTAQLATLFELSPDADNNLLKELNTLCQLFSVTAQDLKFKWDAFVINLQVASDKPTIDLVRQLRKNMQAQVDRQAKTATTFSGLQRKTTSTTSKTLSSLTSDFMDVDVNVDDFMSNFLQAGNKYAKGPAAPVNLAPVEPTLRTQASVSTTAFSERKKTNVIDQQLNAHLAFPAGGATAKPKIRTLNSTIGPYRYMFEKIRNKSEVLDDQIDYLGDVIHSAYGWDEAYGNPTRPTQGSIKAVGRICSEANQGKLNASSLVLETSRSLGMGRRVKLDVSLVTSYSFFPGQIIALQGSNKSGKTFIVEEVYTPPLSSPPSGKAPASAAATTNVVLATGPYTLDTDLTYQPLQELIEECVLTPPDALILMGPFLSCSHPSIVNGEVDELPEDIFAQQVVARVAQLANAQPNIQIVLVPHGNDIVHEWPLFPQPPMASKMLAKHPSIQMLPNPAVIDVQGTLLAFANIDILMAMGQQEVAKGHPTQDRLARLVQHVLHQQSFYPLFPTGPEDMIDAEQMATLQLTVRPDVLILPSQLKSFAKVVDDVICMNPGHLCKRQAGGTYARLGFPSMRHDKQHEHIRVDLIKL